MTRTNLLGLSVAVVVIAVVSTRWDTASAQEKKAPAKLAWEYKVVAKDVDDMAPRNASKDQAEFNKMGNDGWEYCETVGPVTNKGVRFVYVVFKKQRTP